MENPLRYWIIIASNRSAKRVNDHQKRYRVVINSYRRNGRGGYLTRGALIPASSVNRASAADRGYFD